MGLKFLHGYKEFRLRNSRTERGRLGDIYISRECAILAERFYCIETEFLYSKKNPALQDSPPAAGRLKRHLPFRRSAILAERFYCIETEFLYSKKNLPVLNRQVFLFPKSVYAFSSEADSQSFISGLDFPSTKAISLIKLSSMTL